MSRALGLALAAASSACSIAPPMSHVQPVQPGSVVTEPMTEIVASAPSQIAVKATHLRPLRNPTYAADIGVQASWNHVAVTPGWWARTRGHTFHGTHVGVRLGGALGLGDYAGFRPWSLPYIGPSIHGQVARGFRNPEKRGLWAMSLGVDYLVPMVDPTGFRREGDPPIRHGFYVTLDSRVDIPVGSRMAVVVGGGIALLWGLPSANLSTGFRF